MADDLRGIMAGISPEMAQRVLIMLGRLLLDSRHEQTVLLFDQHARTGKTRLQHFVRNLPGNLDHLAVRDELRRQ